MIPTIFFIISSILSNLFLGNLFDTADIFPPSKNVETQTPTKCNLKSYIDDRDPNGTNIRAAPDKNSAILQKIENNDVIVTVTGFSDGWFEISKAEDIGGGTIFQGSGWIHSSLLGMQIAAADARLYALPKKNSRILLKLKPEDAVKLIACQNDWVKIQASGKIGWLAPRGQCANPVTTCP